MEDAKVEFPPLFSELLNTGEEHGDSHKDDDVNLYLICVENDEDDEDAILPPTADFRNPATPSVGMCILPLVSVRSTCTKCVNGQLPD